MTLSRENPYLKGKALDREIEDIGLKLSDPDDPQKRYIISDHNVINLENMR